MHLVFFIAQLTCKCFWSTHIACNYRALAAPVIVGIVVVFAAAAAAVIVVVVVVAAATATVILVHLTTGGCGRK